MSLRFPRKTRKGGGLVWRESIEDEYPEAKIYRDELEAKPETEIAAMVAAERKRLNSEKVAREAAEEAANFYNLPAAMADFDFWCKAAYWKKEEQIALSLGREPRKVFWSNIGNNYFRSPFVEEYRQRKVLVERAIIARQLMELSRPELFLGWARKVGLSYPPELDVVFSQNAEVNWRLEYDKEATSHAKTKRSLEVSEKKLAAASEGEPPIRVRETLLKMLIGMAIDKYGHDAKASKSAAPSRISGILVTHGLGISDDTVRKYLQEAAEFLPTDDP